MPKRSIINFSDLDLKGHKPIWPDHYRYLLLKKCSWFTTCEILRSDQDCYNASFSPKNLFLQMLYKYYFFRAKRSIIFYHLST